MGCQKITYYQEGALVNFEKNLKVDYGKLGFTEKKGFNYYPGGSLLPGRNSNSNEYRYGWNKGSEKDDEITGVTGSHITTYFREYDTRLNRTWSIDPVFQPWQSPYSSMDNNPDFSVKSCAFTFVDKATDKVRIT